MEIKEKSSTVSIDVSKCLSCETKACVAACKKYARGILELKDGVPSVELAGSLELAPYEVRYLLRA